MDCQFCGPCSEHVFGCPYAPSPDETAEVIEKKKKDEESILVGYRSDDYEWFGASVPPHAKLTCGMCQYQVNMKLEAIVRHPIPEICPECNRKALKIYDPDFWKNYHDLKLWEFDFFLDQFSFPYVAMVEHNVRRIEPIRSEAFKAIISMRVKNKSQIENTLIYLDSLTRRSKKQKTLEVRAVKLGDEIWLDVCDSEWMAYRLTKNGWSKERPPMIFRRFTHQLPLKVEKGKLADWKEFISLMNLASDEDKLLYSGYAAALFFPHIAHPILMPLGPQGSAKTTMSIMTRMLIDPSIVQTQIMPSDHERLPHIISHQYLPVFDNCGYLKQETSDMLCQATTGGADFKRTLYTNADDFIITFKRPVILNGVSAPSMSPDLIDRSIIIELERIPETLRMEQSMVEAKRDALLPKVRGFLFDVVCEVLRDGATDSTSLPRMADFARIADACASKMGFKRGELIETYIKTARETAKEAARSDVLMDALMEYLEGQDRWEGSASELMRQLGAIAGKRTEYSNSWPKDAIRASEAILGKLKPALCLMGWDVKKNRSGSKRSLVFVKSGEIKENSGSIGGFME